MERSIVSSNSVPPGLRRDWWPLTRLVVVCLGLYAASFLLPGWQEAGAQVMGLVGEMLRTAFGVLFISPVVAQFYLALMIVPLVIFVLLNDWIYAAAAALLRLLTRSPECLGLRWTSLGLELGAFVALVELLRALAYPLESTYI